MSIDHLKELAKEREKVLDTNKLLKIIIEKINQIIEVLNKHGIS